MRTLLVLLAIAVLVLAGLMYFGIVSIDQTRPGMVQAPKFEADVARVSVGTENKTVAVPTIEVERPANAQSAN
ncbi:MULTISPECIES: hypothetical protein [Sphingomonas]|uniref:Uncharacterized protein n=1 Tax=Sphingomonas cynarae TaxID=930197 RepID=A0ABP7DLN2_9SPHN|nr:hypothetical protein [Sphingomonas sp. CFBP 8760]MBD8545606.1 hypothetical protein [Sphingomonas sp. CFBP 8760]